ncbi:hypothetical protein [Pseudomonas sp. MPC6]|uniref:hypothetical protein n=1 Tax=unclassified Pseudomonas TaxID=196821 RepID=UPI0011109451|nr:hypothetical protein [Pseudomonas sp. MPC6]QCY12230.1 hypothetical protein ELQ88_16295 [Pseudomonas sp. MPC6]
MLRIHLLRVAGRRESAGRSVLHHRPRRNEQEEQHGNGVEGGQDGCRQHELGIADMLAVAVIIVFSNFALYQARTFVTKL